MAIDIRQSLKLTQQLLMTPQLQQAIKLLQLSRFELEQFISTQMSENPILEEGPLESMEEQIQMERETESTATQAIEAQIDEVMNGSRNQEADSEVMGEEREGAATPSQDIDWEAMSRYSENSYEPTGSGQKQQNSDELPNYEQFLAKGKTLAEFLWDQVSELSLQEGEQEGIRVIIGNIDDRGYLVGSLEDLQLQEQISLDQLEDALDTVQRLDPPGVGARDLKECLLLQIRTAGMRNGVIEKIVEHHLKELESRNLPSIAKALGIPLEKVIANVERLLDLEPIPGRAFSGEMAQIVIPDVYVFKMGDKWVVSLNEDGIPKLRVSEAYNHLQDRGAASDKDKAYLQDRLKSAHWLIKSIQQRQRTIFRVAETIVEKQIDFFELGSEHLRPLVLRDVAEAIEMHESTVSRVTTNKYMHTPRGIFELKYFFSSSVHMSDGSDLASESVKQMIMEILKTEDTDKPHSDQKIVKLLQEKGVELARRTVAKYREQLGILPSSRRKKLV